MKNWRVAYVVLAAAVGMTMFAATPAAAAARATEWSAQSTKRPRVEIRPGRLYYRQCVDGLQPVSDRYVGRTVLMPYMRCWWVRG